MRPKAKRMQAVKNKSYKADGFLKSQKPLGLGLVVLVVLLTVLFYALGISSRYDSADLTLGLNILFVVLPSFFIAFIASRSFTRTGVWPVLFMGIGTLTFGLAVLLSNWIRGSSANNAITVYGLSALLAGLFYLFAGFLAFNKVPAQESRSGRLSILVQIYLAAMAFIVFVTVAASKGILPPFFTAGSGGTILRDIIQSMATLLFFLAGMMLLIRYLQSKSALLYWFCLGLLLTCLSLGGTQVVVLFGTPLSWTLRSAQFLGGVYLFIAALVTLKEARARQVSAAEALASLFGESGANLKLLFDSVDVAIISTDTAFSITGWNRAAEDIYGWKAEEILGRPSEDILQTRFLNGRDKEENMRQIMEQGYWSGGVFQRRKDGTDVFISSAVRTVKGNRGQLMGAVLVNRDATEEKRAEDALKESEAKANALIKYAPTGIYEFDYAVPRFLSVNDAMCSLTGYTREELLAMGPSAMLDDDSKKLFAERIKLQLAGKEIGKEVEYRVKRKDGSVMTVTLDVAFSREKPHTALVIGHDITARLQAERELKESEEALRESQTLLRAIWDGSSDPVYVKDMQSRILVCNPALEKVVGKPAAEIIGKTDGEYYGDEATGRELREHDLLVTKSGLAYTVEETVPTPDGPRAFLSSKAPYRNASGEIIGTIGISHDITLRKLAEEARDRYARELESANKELEAFSYSVSHDLRAPLRALDGFSEALLTDCGDSLDETGKGYLNKVRKATQTMSQLIDDMLKLSRVARAQMNEEQVNLSDMAQSIVEELKTNQPERRAEIVIAPDITVNGDRQLLRIFLNNLLENAWKFTAKRPETKIELGINEKNGEKVYFIKDNGVGFDMKYAGKLFQPFQRLHSNREYEGTGIGLATAQRVIRRHGGRIWAESEVGKGATFHFTLNFI
jgi:PAS domain S-box-containing protein